MPSWISLIGQDPHSDFGFSAIGGHALLGVNVETASGENVYETFHFVGARERIPVYSDLIYNGHSAIEHWRHIPEKRRAQSVGGYSRRSMFLGEPLDADWHRRPENAFCQLREGQRFPVTRFIAEDLRTHCLSCVALKASAPFSLIGSYINFGTSCIGWIYSVLELFGMTFSPEMYNWSLVSPWKGILNGGCLQLVDAETIKRRAHIKAMRNAAVMPGTFPAD